MNIEQFEISIGDRVAKVPNRQNEKARQFQEARKKAKEAAKAKVRIDTSPVKTINEIPVQEALIVHEPVVQEVINSIIQNAIPAQEFSLPTIDSESDSESVDDTVIASPLLEELSVEPRVDTFIKLEPEVFPAPEPEVTQEPEVTAQAEQSPIIDTYIEEMIVSDDEDAIVLSAPKPSTITIVDDDEIFEIQEIQDPDL